MKFFDMYRVHCKEEDTRDDPLPCTGLGLLVAAYGVCGRSQYLLFGSLFCQLQRPLTTTLRSAKATYSMLNWSLGGSLYVHAGQPNFWIMSDTFKTLESDHCKYICNKMKLIIFGNKKKTYFIEQFLHLCFQYASKQTIVRFWCLKYQKYSKFDYKLILPNLLKLNYCS